MKNTCVDFKRNFHFGEAPISKFVSLLMKKSYIFLNMVKTLNG